MTIKFNVNKRIVLGLAILISVIIIGILLWIGFSYFKKQNDMVLGLQDKLSKLQVENLSNSTSSENMTDKVKVTKTDNLDVKAKELSAVAKEPIKISGSTAIGYEKFIPNIVQISCANGSGSGTIISNNTILTNYHVIEGNKECLVGFTTDIYHAPSEWTKGTVKSINSKLDKAILTVDHILANKTMPKCDSKITKIGDDLVILGYPDIGGETLTLTNGVISGFIDGYIKTSAKISYGNSGGAAIHKTGCYLGIPTAYIGSKAESLGYIVDERIGTSSNEPMIDPPIVSDQQQQQQQNQTDQSLRAQVAEYKDDYESFIGQYNLLDKSYTDAISDIQKAFDYAKSEQYASANYYCEQARSKVLENQGYFTNIRSFTYFKEIDDLKSSFSSAYTNLSQFIEHYKRYLIYRQANNYSEATIEYNQAIELLGKIKVNEDQSEAYLKIIKDKADQYFY